MDTNSIVVLFMIGLVWCGGGEKLYVLTFHFKFLLNTSTESNLKVHCFSPKSQIAVRRDGWVHVGAELPRGAATCPV